MAASRFRRYLKRFPLLERLKRRLFDPTIHTRNTRNREASVLNILTTFPQFRPFSAGTYEQRSVIAIQTINRAFPILSSFASSLGHDPQKVKPIKSFSQSNDDLAATAELKELFDRHGSDKAIQDYHYLYGPILKDREAIKAVLEIGIGTNHTDVVSHMMNGTPGASLRAFRDYLANAQVYGADIDASILFEECRIKTFFVDQTKPESFEALSQAIPTDLDLIIDDGLHSPDANISTLLFAVSRVRAGGWVVIEDITMEAQSIWEVVAALLPANYQSHLLETEGRVKEMVFAVKRLS
jgi:hypothetical protein